MMNFGRGPDKKKRKSRSPFGAIKKRVLKAREGVSSKLSNRSVKANMNNARKGKFGVPSKIGSIERKVGRVISTDKKQFDKNYVKSGRKEAREEYKTARQQAERLNAGQALTPKEKAAAGLLLDKKKNKYIAAKLRVKERK